MRKIERLLKEYGSSHKNDTNKKIHWICVPAIFWSVVALIYSIPNASLLSVFGDTYLSNWAVVVLVLVVVYYFTLSITLGFGMTLVGVLAIALSETVSQIAALPLWAIALIVFFIAWIGQFWGHKIEGKKPSFLKDLQFLLIGPAWLMHFMFKRLGIKY